MLARRRHGRGEEQEVQPLTIHLGVLLLFRLVRPRLKPALSLQQDQQDV